ncbi:unnamed protein product [Citrullus colocynthis]|uniref:Uncharacterized protein n=1 Tax=Citrullus colocynthis TaxID=252529 RepID=A0ABP0XUY4_9ROSI
MNLSEKELEEQLKEIGSELLKPPSSIDALLKALDKAECLLTNVEQSPTRSMRDALLPLMKALISDKILKHSEEDVKVTVTSCITEITRITAPDAPYDDEKMKVIFQLTLEAFKKLSNVSGRCYTKALSILDAVAKVRLCLVMLDLECDNLILEMFQNFLKLIRSNHPTAVFSAMEAIMTNVLDESEEISLDLLRPILASVRKENQEAASISWKLGEKVMSNCATKLQPYLAGAVQSLGASLNDYAPIVISICQNGTDNIDAGNRLENDKSDEKGMNSNEPTLVTQTQTPDASVEENPKTGGASESLISNGTVVAGNDNILKASSRKPQKGSEQLKMTEIKVADNLESMKAEDTLDSVPKKRGRKPNSLMNPDEGYDHYWIGKGRERSRLSNRKKSNDQETKFSPVSLRVEKVSLPTEVEKVSSGHTAEKHIQSGDEVLNENMKKMEENARVRSRKSKVGKSRKDKTTAFSPVSPRVEKASLTTEEEKESPAHAEEKHIQSEDEVVNENMKKMEEKARVRSRKSKVGKSSKDEATKFSSVSPKVKKTPLSTEVEKESSAQTEDKRIQVEDEVVNENMEKVVEKAQVRSRKSTVGKSRKDKATKFSSISPRVQKDSLTTEVEKESSALAEEPSQSEDEVENENMENMVEKAQPRSRKSRIGKSRKDKATKLSSISPRVQKDSLTTEVEKESSAHAEEKPLQSEDEVENENMENMVEKAQPRSRKSTVGKSRKDKATKLSSVSRRVQKDSLTTEVEKESSAHAEEIPLQSEDEVANENMKIMEEKAQARSKKSEVGKSKKDKAIHDPGCVVSEEKVSVPSDYKEKRSVHLIMKLRVKSTKGDGSVVQKDVIVKSIDTNMVKNTHEPSTCEVKDSISTKLGGDDYLEETPKAKATRKHAIMEKEVMDISSAGEELVGRRIKVWWPLDRMFYEGVVRSFDPVKKKHQVSYDDGDEEILNLKKQRYELIGADPLLVGDVEMDEPKTDASSDIPRERKRKTMSESDKEEKTSSSTRRGRASSKRKSEVKSAKSSEKAANSSMLKKSVISDESMDDEGSVDNNTKGNDKKLIDLIKNSRLKINLKSKQNAAGRE